MEDLNKNIATTYDRDNRGIPRLFAKHITRLAPEITSESVIHDNACGPAIVASEIMSYISPGTTPSIAATDISPAMITASENVIKANKWDYIDAAIMDSKKLAFDDNMFSHSFTNFIVPSHPDATSEIYRTLGQDGTAIFTCWKVNGFIDLIRPCSKDIRPNSAIPEPLPSQEPTEDSLREHFEAAGFQKKDIQVEYHGEFLQCEDLDDFISLTEGPFGKFFTKNWSAEEIKKVPDAVNRLLTTEELERKSLEMVAWIVIAKKT